MASLFAFGGYSQEVTALKAEVARLTGERADLLQRCRDVEARAQAPAQQPQAGTDLQHFIETATISIFGIDMNGKVNAWNSRVEELMGRKAQDVLGHTLHDVLSHSNETPAETRTEVCTTPSFIYIHIYIYIYIYGKVFWRPAGCFSAGVKTMICDPMAMVQDIQKKSSQEAAGRGGGV